MRTSQVVKALHVAIKARRPVFLWGSPGSGKSDLVRQVQQEMQEKLDPTGKKKFELIDLRLSQLDPVDLRGVPSVDVKTHKTRWNTPSFLPTEGQGIIFLDELNSACQATQAAAYQLLLDFKLGDYELPEGWSIAAAGNRATDKAIVNQMGTALKSRLLHVDVEVNNDDWCRWALTNNIHETVLGFLRFRPALLNEFDSRGNSAEEKQRMARMKDQNTFGVPRTWKFMSDLMHAEVDKEIELEMFTGTVGEGCAVEFAAYMKYYRDLPNIDMILMNPKTAVIPTQPATLYAVSTGVASRATPDNMERVVEYALRLPKEFQVMLIKDAGMRDPKVCATKSFNHWALENADILF